MTTSTDNVTGGNGNDTITGIFGSATAANNTLNTGDTIDGGAGNDALNLTAVGTTASAIADIKNVENINIKDLVGSAFNAILVTDAAKIDFTNTITGNTSIINNLANFDTIAGIQGHGNLTVNYADATGSDDTAKVAINGLGSKASNGTITRSTVNVSNTNAMENVSIDATGTNYFTLNGGTALKTVTVTGDGAVDTGATTALTGDATNNKLTYDASASTGKQTITFGAGAMTVKGGSADDTFNFGSTMGSTDSVDGGEGADKVTFTLSTAVQTIPELTNVETVAATFNAAGIVNASKMSGVTTLDVKGTAASNFTNLDNSVQTITIEDAAGTDAFGYASGSSADVAINFGDINTAANGVGANLTLTGLNVTGNAGAVTINSTVDADNTAAVTNTTGAINVGTATALTLNTEKYANLTTGALTANSATSLTLNADSGAISAGALATADKLQTLTINSTNDANVTMGIIGATKDASALTDIKVDVASKVGSTAATANIGAINVATDSTTSTASTSALKNVNLTFGDGVRITNSPAIDGLDNSTSQTLSGAGVSQLDTYNLTVGANATTTAMGAVSVRDITAAKIDSATTLSQTLNVDDTLGSLDITSSTAGQTVTATVNGINDAAATDNYNLDISTITATGAGNVVLGGLGQVGGSTVINSIATIDLSGVTGTSEVAASTLGGTAGINITIGEGGTTSGTPGTTGVNGSNLADIITGGKGADEITGGAGADQIKGGEGADTIAGGAGNDTIDLSETTSVADNIAYSESGSANVDSVTGFTAGTDIVALDAGTNAMDATTTFVTEASGTATATAAAETPALLSVTTDTNVALGSVTGNVLFFNSTTSTSFATAIGTAVIDVDTNNNTADDAATTADELTTADTFVEIVRVGMTTSDYTAANIASDIAFF